MLYAFGAGIARRIGRFVEASNSRSEFRGDCGIRAARIISFSVLVGAPLSTFEVVAAECPQKEDPIATDRPDTTNSSRVVPQGSFQSENGITLSQRDAGRVVDGTESRLRTGVAPCFEILLDLPTYFAAVGGKPNQALPTWLQLSNGK